MKLPKFYLLLALIIFAFSFSACSKKDNQEKTNDERGESIVKEESYFSGSVASLFEQKKPLQCTANFEDEEGSVNMTYYFDNKGEKFRVNTYLISKYDSNKINSFGIFVSDWYYFWDDFENIDGMKTKIFEENDNDDSDSDYDFDMDEDFDFKCKSWEVDSSFFDLPKDKTFKDLTEMFNSINFIDSVDSDFNFCSYCEMLPAGPERDECLNDC